MSTRCFDNFCENETIVSLGPKRSIGRNISKNNCFHGDKKFGAFFLVLSSVTTLEKQFTRVHYSSYHYCINSRNNFSGLKRLLKTQNFEKKRQKFQWKKMIRQVFLVLSGVIGLRKHFKRVHTLFLLLLFNLYMIFLRLHMLLKTQIFLANFPVKKNFGLFFFVLSNMKNVKKQFIRVHKVFLTFTVQVIRSFLGT